MGWVFLMISFSFLFLNKGTQNRGKRKKIGGIGYRCCGGNRGMKNV